MRFSIRSLLLLLTAVSLWCGYYYSRVNTQRLAAQAIQEAGGKIVYGWQVEGDKPSQPEWLRRTLGPHFFDEIVGVRFNQCGHRGGTHLAEIGPELRSLKRLKILTLWCMELDKRDYQTLGALERLQKLTIALRFSLNERDAAELAKITTLRSLSLKEVIISPESVASLARLPNLEELHIGSHSPYSLPSGSLNERLAPHRLTDDHARSLVACKQLRELYLLQTVITDEGIAALCGLRDLRSLVVSSPEATGGALKTLKPLSRLTWLGTWQWRLEDEDLLTLNELPSLTGVSLLTSTDVTDQSVPYLAKLNRLEKLVLGSRCQITDAGLEPFKSMTRLKRLDLSDSLVNKRGPAAKELLAALPDCAIRLPMTADEKERKAAFQAWKWGQTDSETKRVGVN